MEWITYFNPKTYVKNNDKVTGSISRSPLRGQKKTLLEIKFLSLCLIYERIKVRNQGQRSRSLSCHFQWQTWLWSSNGTWYRYNYAMITNKFCTCIHCRNVGPRGSFPSVFRDPWWQFVEYDVPVISGPDVRPKVSTGSIVGLAQIRVSLSVSRGSKNFRSQRTISVIFLLRYTLPCFKYKIFWNKMSSLWF